MVKEVFYSIVLVCFGLQIHAQKTCNDAKKKLKDANTINKCKAKQKKISLSKQIDVKVPSPRSRVIRKQKSVSDANSISSGSLEDVNGQVTSVGDLELANGVESVPFNLADEKPMFSKCEGVVITEQEKCFKTKLTNHIKTNFRYPQKSYEKGVQGRVWVQFLVNEFGEVTNVVSRGPVQGEELEEEGKRIIERLSKFKAPGKLRGNSVKVKFNVPIIFKIEGRDPTNVNSGE